MPIDKRSRPPLAGARGPGARRGRRAPGEDSGSTPRRAAPAAAPRPAACGSTSRESAGAAHSGGRRARSIARVVAAAAGGAGRGAEREPRGPRASAPPPGGECRPGPCGAATGLPAPGGACEGSLPGPCVCTGDRSFPECVRARARIRVYARICACACRGVLGEAWLLPPSDTAVPSTAAWRLRPTVSDLCLARGDGRQRRSDAGAGGSEDQFLSRIPLFERRCVQSLGDRRRSGVLESRPSALAVMNMQGRIPAQSGR